VLDAHPPHRWRRFKPAVIARLETLAEGTPEDLLLQILEGQIALASGQLVSLAGLGIAEAKAAVDKLIAQGEILTLPGDLLIARASWARISSQMTRELRAYHDAYPLRLGMPREALRSRLRLEAKLFNKLADFASQLDLLTGDGIIVRLPDHSVRFSDSEQAAADRLWNAIQVNPMAPPSVKDATDIVGEEVLQALIEQGKLVQISPEVLFDAETYQQLVEGIEQFIQTQGSITVSQARDLFNTSRKYVLPFLEHLDAIGMTRRMGDERVLRHSGQ
jgi:selenocysteine-specific elongation factor